MRGHTRHSRSHFSLAFGAFKTLLTSSLLRPRTQALAPRQQQLRKAWPIYQIAKLLLDRMVADSDMAFRLRCPERTHHGRYQRHPLQQPESIT